MTGLRCLSLREADFAVGMGAKRIAALRHGLASAAEARPGA